MREGKRKRVTAYLSYVSSSNENEGFPFKNLSFQTPRRWYVAAATPKPEQRARVRAAAAGGRTSLASKLCGAEAEIKWGGRREGGREKWQQRAFAASEGVQCSGLGYPPHCTSLAWWVWQSVGVRRARFTISPTIPYHTIPRPTAAAAALPIPYDATSNCHALEQVSLLPSLAIVNCVC